MSGKQYRSLVRQEPRPRAEAISASVGRHSSIQREQELCQLAIESGEYDTMTDKQWVELCERTARDEKERGAGDSVDVLDGVDSEED